MKILVDSNVLIAGLLVSHQNHRPSRDLLDHAFRAEPEPFISAHGLAETYAQLTSIPQLRVSPHIAAASMMRDVERMTVVALDDRSYVECLAEARQRSLTGGRIYDLLHVTAAFKASASILVTWNVKHFIGLCEGTGLEPLTPLGTLEQL